jgi:hypothetical protein
MLPFIICAAVPLFLFMAFNSLPRMNRAATETHAPELIFVLYLMGGWLGLVFAGGLLSLVFAAVGLDALAAVWALTCGAMILFTALWILQVMRFSFFADQT